MPFPAPRSRYLLIGLVIVATAGAVTAPVAAQSAAEPAFVVDLRADGSAVVSVRSTFDLTTEAELAAFRALEEDQQARDDAAARFLDRLRTVAADAENATGRDMRVTDVRLDLRRTADNETGVITLSATWTGLAAVSGETLTVTEPFASGFEPDRRFVLRAPAGYTVAGVSPEPASRDTASATWDAGTDLTGFEVVLEPAAPTTTESEGQPGFGALAALVALLVGAGIATRRGS